MSMKLMTVFLLSASVILLASSSDIENILRSNNNYRKRTMSTSLMESLSIGVQKAVTQCQEAFKWDRWNCPLTAFTRNSKQFTKESAYVKAIISAGIVHTITRNCSRGELPDCGCDPNLTTNKIVLANSSSSHLKSYDASERSKNVEWSWGGCSDDTTYAESVASKYFDSLEKGSPAKVTFGKHNNRIGREIVKEHMIKKCRCHGISGSCSMQTCWKQVAPFAVIASKLKDRYKKAKRLDFNVNNGNTVRHTPESAIIQQHQDALMYLDDSPNYCNPDPQSDWLGTQGRICSRNSSNETLVSGEEKKSCRRLCRTCGYRVRKQKKTVLTRCNCNFVWCCEVKCEMCPQTIEEHFCY